MYETALEPDELIVSVEFPVPERAAYEKFRNPASHFALVGVFVAKFASGVRVAVTGAAASVFRVPELESALSANFTPESARAVSVPSANLNDDMHASAEYRAHLIPVLAARAVAKANA
jgi:carbon-monoxide dehydrogenase medium subunit